jgi:hypothetical protein
MTSSGQGLWGLSSNQFSFADAIQKGGLSSYQSAPSTPVTNGSAISGFSGTATINGNVIATLRSAKVGIDTGNVLETNVFGAGYALVPDGDSRSITTSFSLFEDDGAGFTALVTAAESKTLVDFHYQLGLVAGNIVTLNVIGVQLPIPMREEERRYLAAFGEGIAHGTGNKDELTIAFT